VIACAVIGALGLLGVGPFAGIGTIPASVMIGVGGAGFLATVATMIYGCRSANKQAVVPRAGRPTKGYTAVYTTGDPPFKIADIGPNDFAQGIYNGQPVALFVDRDGSVFKEYGGEAIPGLRGVNEDLIPSN